jgi:hypothetical protein
VGSGILIALLPVSARLNKILDHVDSIIFVHDFLLLLRCLFATLALAEIGRAKLARKGVLL